MSTATRKKYPNCSWCEYRPVTKEVRKGMNVLVCEQCYRYATLITSETGSLKVSDRLKGLDDMPM